MSGPGRIVLVTGASRGLGYAVAAELGARGAQVIATYMGAELVRVDNHVGRHAVEGPGGGRIVNSFHNYGFVQPPYGVEVGARSADGVIESFTGRTTRVLAMMWHPERNVPFEAEDIRSIRGFLGIDACAD